MKDGFIDGLVAEARPVRPVRAPALMLPWALAALAAIASLCHSYLGCRHDLVREAGDPTFLAIVTALAIAGSFAAYQALLSALPGRRPSRFASAGFLSASLLLLAVLGYLTLRTGIPTEWAEGSNPAGVGCIRVLGLLILLPVLVFALLGRKLAPTRPHHTVWWSVLACGAWAAAGVSFVCSSGSAFHLGLWHLLPVLPIAALSALMAKRFWRW